MSVAGSNHVYNCGGLRQMKAPDYTDLTSHNNLLWPDCEPVRRIVGYCGGADGTSKPWRP